MNDETKFISRRFIVTGKVQGVFFRASTKREAVAKGLTGYAKNLASGQVEVLAQGDADSVDELERWLQDGPEFAEVESVVEVDGESEVMLENFKIL